MHATTSYSQITASFDAALLQIDTSSSPGSSSEEPSPIAMHSPIRWERKLHQPIKIEINDDVTDQRTNEDLSSPEEPIKPDFFLLQPVKKPRDRPIRKVRSLKKIVEDDSSGSNSDSKLSKSLLELARPFMMNGDHCLDSDNLQTKQNIQSSLTANVAQGKSNLKDKYRVLNEIKPPAVNGTNYAKDADNDKQDTDGTLVTTEKGDTWETSAVRFCISDSSDEEDNTQTTYMKEEFVLDI